MPPPVGGLSAMSTALPAMVFTGSNLNNVVDNPVSNCDQIDEFCNSHFQEPTNFCTCNSIRVFEPPGSPFTRQVVIVEQGGAARVKVQD
ncbi:hypothetical protein [Hydrogenophaga sp. PAMC20947]|uniref:hypothetical protein n=1 Tax=Hydrogenophaga sp. PAMC20947 TaxID=2565558 RepID=UPI00109DA33F|nr:hypothetical protein [Hydrogenophaga sp. PAMC20947]QCB46897.1 hypothetical protein E5678_13215 [Hydrogenophaga sp. PAMC20947]